MTGFESKRVMSASRHADSETIEHIIALRRENEMLKLTIRDILELYNSMKDQEELHIQTIDNLRKATHGASK